MKVRFTRTDFNTTKYEPGIDFDISEITIDEPKNKYHLIHMLQMLINTSNC